MLHPHLGPANRGTVQLLDRLVSIAGFLVHDERETGRIARNEAIFHVADGTELSFQVSAVHVVVQPSHEQPRHFVVVVILRLNISDYM